MHGDLSATGRRLNAEFLDDAVSFWPVGVPAPAAFVRRHLGDLSACLTAASADTSIRIGSSTSGSATGMSPSDLRPPRKCPLQMRSCCNHRATPRRHRSSREVFYSWSEKWIAVRVSMVRISTVRLVGSVWLEARARVRSRLMILAGQCQISRPLQY